MLNRFIFMATFIFSNLALADGDFEYFNQGIDYWNNKKVHPPENVSSPSESEAEKKKDSFDWNRYLNPKNDEFFKEGNYTPPAPFMELARNPSDQNIKNWISYNKLKNQLSQRLKDRMQSYLAKESGIENRGKAIEILKSKSKQLKMVSIDPGRYRIRMYFDSKCPHCKRMFQTLVELQNEGIFVEALQVDRGTFRSLRYPIPIRPASEKELKQHKIESVPFTLIADLKKKVLYPPIRGYQSKGTVLNLMKEAQNL